MNLFSFWKRGNRGDLPIPVAAHGPDYVLRQFRIGKTTLVVELGGRKDVKDIHTFVKYRTADGKWSRIAGRGDTAMQITVDIDY